MLRSFETGKRPFPPSVTSDSRWLLVPGYDSGDVTIIELVAGKPSATVKVGSRPSGGAVLPMDSTYAVANRGSNSISVVDLTTRTIQSSIDSGLDQEPFSIVLSRDGRLAFVNNTASASVTVIDVARLRAVGRVAVGKQPIVMAVHPSGRKLYVSCEGSHELTVVAVS